VAVCLLGAGSRYLFGDLRWDWGRWGGGWGRWGGVLRGRVFKGEGGFWGRGIGRGGMRGGGG